MPSSWISSDKIGHIIAYSVLAFLIFVGLSKQTTITSAKILITILLCTLYGVLLEFIQYHFYPNRFFEIWDAVANFVGSVIGFLTFKAVFNIK
jgi:VanZ family protein